MATNPIYEESGPAEVVEISEPAATCPPLEPVYRDERPAIETLLQSYAEQVGRLYGRLVRHSRELSREAKEFGEQTYHQGEAKAREMSDATRRQIARVRRERPLEALSIVCGAGLIAGIALRVWRSHRP